MERTTPISNEEILEAIYKRIITECEKDEGEVHLEFIVDDPDYFMEDLTTYLTDRNIPIAQIQNHKIRAGIVYLKFIPKIS